MYKVHIRCLTSCPGVIIIIIIITIIFYLFIHSFIFIRAHQHKATGMKINLVLKI